MVSASRRNQFLSAPIMHKGAPYQESSRSRDVLAITRHARYPSASGGRRLFLGDLGVFDHGDAAALGQFTLERNRLTAVLSELIVHWLVLADDEIGFAVADDPDRAAALDAFRSTGL